MRILAFFGAMTFITYRQQLHVIELMISHDIKDGQQNDMERLLARSNDGLFIFEKPEAGSTKDLKPVFYNERLCELLEVD